MGLMQRRKGCNFERRIATLLREKWPNAIVRRASQGERADQSDVFIEGGPDFLARLWLELQDAKNPNPLVKLKQAEDDASIWLQRRLVDDRPRAIPVYPRLPVVVWHRLSERTTWLTLRAKTLHEIAGLYADCYETTWADLPLRFESLVITVDFEDFLAAL